MKWILGIVSGHLVAHALLETEDAMWCGRNIDPKYVAPHLVPKCKTCLKLIAEQDRQPSKSTFKVDSQVDLKPRFQAIKKLFESHPNLMLAPVPNARFIFGAPQDPPNDLAQVLMCVDVVEYKRVKRKKVPVGQPFTVFEEGLSVKEAADRLFASYDYD